MSRAAKMPRPTSALTNRNSSHGSSSGGRYLAAAGICRGANTRVSELCSEEDEAAVVRLTVDDLAASKGCAAAEALEEHESCRVVAAAILVGVER